MIALALQLVLSEASFEAIDQRVVAELERMRRAEREIVVTNQRQLERQRRTGRYEKPMVPEPPSLDFKVVGMTGEYVDACLERRRVCPGPPWLHVEWLLTNRPDAFAALSEWVRLRGSQEAVPPFPIGRLLSREQAAELALNDVSAGWALAVAQAYEAQHLAPQRRAVVFDRLQAFDEGRPGSVSFWLVGLDERRGCEYLTGLLEKKLDRGTITKVRTELRHFCTQR